MVRSLFAQRFISMQPTIPGVDSASTPSNAAGIGYPATGNGTAAGFGGGHNRGQSYDPGEHRTR